MSMKCLSKLQKAIIVSLILEYINIKKDTSLEVELIRFLTLSQVTFSYSYFYLCSLSHAGMFEHVSFCIYENKYRFRVKTGKSQKALH